MGKWEVEESRGPYVSSPATFFLDAGDVFFADKRTYVMTALGGLVSALCVMARLDNAFRILPPPPNI